MKYFYNLSLILFCAAVLGGCSVLPSITRTEQDVYTITQRDTTVNQQVRNAPGDRDNGIIYPSSRTTEINHDVTQHDSIVTREYPNFIRLGLFESVGMMGTASGENSLRPGLFGLFYDVKDLLDIAYLFDTTGKAKRIENTLFSGAIYRFGIGEWRLRWFRDSPNWTIGVTAFEMLIPTNKREDVLASTTVSIRKRYYLRDEIPYVCITPAVSIGAYPSLFGNLSASVDVGSIGGLNLRGYVGYASGWNWAGSTFVQGTDKVNSGASSSFPYAGIGVSVLDFLNRDIETEREWKDHEHSAWNIGLAQVTFLKSGADTSFFYNRSNKSDQNPGGGPLSGFILRLAPTSVALPFWNNQFYVGTSLLNMLALGKNKFGIGILPIRAGYWQPIIDDEFSTEPFIEYNYFPSTFFHVGNRLNFRLSDQFNFNIAAGYASGSTISDGDLSRDILLNFGNLSAFSGGYVGFGISISDRIFFPQELRYNR
ncbi:MAG: hypothetical protein V4642_12710 [Bacteroidota bacterium]